MDVILQAERLRLDYGDRCAVRDVSFRIRGGEILGFLGPNGAGKTSAIRVLTTILPPTAGAFSVAGIGHHEPDRIRARIGVLPESHGFPTQTTAFEHLVTFGRMHGLDRGAARDRAEELLALVGLADRRHTLITTFSRGMRQRLGIARALVNDPEVLFFDEPTLGLDPKGQEELIHLIRDIAKEHGAGVVLCSHLLDEVETVCDSVLIMQEGQVVAAGPVAEIVGDSRLKETFLALTETA